MKLQYPECCSLDINGKKYTGYLKYYESNGYVYLINVENRKLLIPARDASEMEHHKYTFTYKKKKYTLEER